MGLVDKKGVSIRLSHVTKVFVDPKKKKDTYAVNDFDVLVPAGKLVGLLGPSGCGKSTTLYMISGLLNGKDDQQSINKAFDTFLSKLASTGTHRGVVAKAFDASNLVTISSLNSVSLSLNDNEVIFIDLKERANQIIPAVGIFKGTLNIQRTGAFKQGSSNEAIIKVYRNNAWITGTAEAVFGNDNIPILEHINDLVEGDIAVVIQDETHNNESWRWMYSESVGWFPLGPDDTDTLYHQGSNIIIDSNNNISFDSTALDDYYIKSETNTLINNSTISGINAANFYSDQKAASGLVSANAYTDNKAASGLLAANNYTDNKVSSGLTVANNYSDAKAASGLVEANKYTDAKPIPVSGVTQYGRNIVANGVANISGIVVNISGGTGVSGEVFSISGTLNNSGLFSITKLDIDDGTW